MIPYWLLWGFFFLGVLLSQRQEQAAGHEPDRQFRLPGMAVAGLIGMALMIGFRYDGWRRLGLLRHHVSSRAGLRTFDQTLAAGRSRLRFPELAAQQLGADVWLVNLVCGAADWCGASPHLSGANRKPWLSLLITIPYLIIVVGMGYTRQAAALGLVMVGLASLLNNGSLLALHCLRRARRRFSKSPR